MAPDSRVIKTGKVKFEIIQPTRTWFIEEFKAGTIDKWISEIKKVIDELPE